MLPVFFAFRLMVGLGVLMIAIGAVGAWLWWRGRLFETRWYLQSVQYAWPLGFIAILVGLVRDRDRPSAVDRRRHPAHGGCRLARCASARCCSALVLFVLVYGVVFSMGIFYINRLIEYGPKGAATDADARACHRGRSSAAEDAANVAMEET